MLDCFFFLLKGICPPSYYYRDLTKLQQHSDRNVKTTIGLMSKTTVLCTFIMPFCKILCCFCTTAKCNGQILSLLENGKGKAINSLSDFGCSDLGLQKILNGCKVYFSTMSSWKLPFLDCKVPNICT